MSSPNFAQGPFPPILTFPPPGGKGLTYASAALPIASLLEGIGTK